MVAEIVRAKCEETNRETWGFLIYPENPELVRAALEEAGFEVYIREDSGFLVLSGGSGG